MRKSIVYTLIACLLVSSLPFSVTADANDDIPTNAAGTGIHDSLVAALTQADLVTTLQGTGPFTVFAPTDQAFADAGIDLTTFDTDEENATLVDILTYHVVSGKVMSTDLTDGMEAAARNQDTLTCSVSSSEVKVNDAVVTLADVESSNGVIHVIDKVLMPPADPVYVDIPATAQSTGVHTALVAALSQANLVATLQGEGPFTVFAPTDQAFTDAGIDLSTFDTPEENATLADMLLYHVYAGAVPASAVTDGLAVTMVNGDKASFTVGADGSVSVGDATVTSADVQTSNGIIHVIDKVLTPTTTPNNIPRTAQCTGVHDSLVAAVIQAELLETLQGDGPFTLFAPTDQAFTEAGIDLAALDTPEGKTALADILLYHVVPSAVPASAVTECMTPTAVNGQPLSFTVGDSVIVNGATVTSADVNTSNGIIHVIDAVLTPSDAPNDIPRTAQCTGIHDSLVAAVIQAELLETLQGDGPFTLFAPTDQAFADAGIDLAALNTPEGKATLTDILLYHVHTGSVQASDITEGMMLQMVNGDNTTLSLTTGINGANITLADVATSNGIIHVIDKVLMPPAETVDDSSDSTAGTSDEDEGGWLTILLVVLVVLGGGAGAVLFMRGRGEDEPEPAMTIGQAGMITQLTPVEATPYTPQPATAYATQAVQQPQVVQPVAQVQAQPVQPIQTVEVIPAVVAEPTVLRQWTDGNGYTWRAMDDGNTYWWTGTEWQKYA